MYDFFDFLDRRDAIDFLSDKAYADTNPLLLEHRQVGDREQAARDFLSDKAYADTNPDMITSDSDFDWKKFGKDALGSFGSQGGEPKLIGKTDSESGPAAPKARGVGYNPTPEPIEYGVPLEVLTNIQLRAQTEAYLRNLYDQAMRERIRRPNVISLI